MIWVAKNLYFFNCLLDGAHTKRFKIVRATAPFCCAKSLQEALQEIQQKILQDRDVMRLLMLNLRVRPLHQQRQYQLTPGSPG